MHARGLSLGFGPFLSLLVHTAHARMEASPPAAAPNARTAAKGPAPTASHVAAAAALPAALSSMLTGLVLPRAPRDSAQALRARPEP